MEIQQIIEMLAEMSARMDANTKEMNARLDANYKEVMAKIDAETEAIEAKTKAMRNKRMKANKKTIQERMEADRKSDRGLKRMMNVAQERLDANLKDIKGKIKSGQAEMRSIICAFRSQLNETIQSEMRAANNPYGHSWMR
jgi:hypothetical protein